LISPSLNSLLSRRTDPASQGGILGIGQSVNAVGRITGSFIGIPLLVQGTQLPFLLSGVLLTITLFLVAWAARAGKDFVAGSEPEPRL